MTAFRKDRAWLDNVLQAQGIERARNVLVALLSTQGVLLIQEKGEGGRLINVPVMKSGEVKW